MDTADAEITATVGHRKGRPPKPRDSAPQRTTSRALATPPRHEQYDVSIHAGGWEERNVPRKRVTTDLIEKYLDQHGWPKHDQIDEPSEKEGIVVTGWSSPLSREGHLMFIDPMVEREEMVFTVTDIAKAPTDATPSDRLSGLLLTIAAVNAELIMGGFAYKPSNGELIFRLGIPIASDDLRYEDFESCLTAIVSNVERYASDLRDIIEGTKTAQDVLG
jgi:hypothetical protein